MLPPCSASQSKAPSLITSARLCSCRGNAGRLFTGKVAPCNSFLLVEVATVGGQQQAKIVSVANSLYAAECDLSSMINEDILEVCLGVRAGKAGEGPTITPVKDVLFSLRIHQCFHVRLAGNYGPSRDVRRHGRREGGCKGKGNPIATKGEEEGDKKGWIVQGIDCQEGENRQINVRWDVTACRLSLCGRRAPHRCILGLQLAGGTIMGPDTATGCDVLPFPLQVRLETLQEERTMVSWMVVSRVPHTSTVNAGLLPPQHRALRDGIVAQRTCQSEHAARVRCSHTSGASTGGKVKGTRLSSKKVTHSSAPSEEQPGGGTSSVMTLVSAGLWLTTSTTCICASVGLCNSTYLPGSRPETRRVTPCNTARPCTSSNTGVCFELATRVASSAPWPYLWTQCTCPLSGLMRGTTTPIPTAVMAAHMKAAAAGGSFCSPTSPLRSTEG